MDNSEIVKKLETLIRLHETQLKIGLNVRDKSNLTQRGNLFEALEDVLDNIRFGIDAIGIKYYGNESKYYEAKDEAKEKKFKRRVKGEE